MNADFFHEPELEFGVAKHIDMKFGLMSYGPLDFQISTAPKKIISKKKYRIRGLFMEMTFFKIARY